jgi:hypothetical protein
MLKFSLLQSSMVVASSGSHQWVFLCFRAHLHTGWQLYHHFQIQLTHFKVKVSVNLQLAVYRQSLHLGIKPLGTNNQRFLFQLNPCGSSPYVASSLRRRWVCLLWICLAFHQMYISHTENSSFCAIYKSSVSTGFAEIMPSLHILFYNGSLVTWMFVSLTTAKFKLLKFYWLTCQSQSFLFIHPQVSLDSLNT